MQFTTSLTHCGVRCGPLVRASFATVLIVAGAPASAAHPQTVWNAARLSALQSQALQAMQNQNAYTYLTRNLSQILGFTPGSMPYGYVGGYAMIAKIMQQWNATYVGNAKGFLSSA